MKLEELRLIGPRVLVLRDAPAAAINGIIIPGSARTRTDKVLEGTVLKVGNGRLSRKKGVIVPMSVTPGDRVFYGFLDGYDFNVDGKEYVILEDSEVRAIL